MIPVLTMRSLFLRYIVHLLCLTHFSFVASHSVDENPQVLEHVTPLAAEVGPEFERAQASGAQKDKAPATDAGTSEAPRVRKTPASDAGSGEARPSKRQKKGSSGPLGRKRKHDMPVATG